MTNARSQTSAQTHLYLRDTYLNERTTEVTDVGVDTIGHWCVLAENLFHPQGGGQPADSGSVDGAVATPFRLPDDRAVVGLRLTDSSRKFSVGQQVSATIDLERRRLHAALHTAGHVVQAIAEERGWGVVGNNHFPGQARVEFQVPPEVHSALSDLTTFDALWRHARA